MMKITLLTVFLLLSYNCFSNEIENLEKSIDKLNKTTVDYGNINNIILEEILKKGSISPEKARIIIRKLEEINKKILIKANSNLTSNLPILKTEEKNKLSLTSNLPMLMIEETNNIFSGWIQDIIKSIRSVCAAPDQKGKYWNIDASGDTKVKIKFLDSHAGISGEFSEGEWEGIQRVLKEQQAGENKDYRECVKSLTPIFIKNFILKGNNFSLDLTAYEEGDLPSELGEDLVILNKNGKNIISGLKNKKRGKIEIKNLKLKNKFRVEIMTSLYIRGETTFILRTRDDDIENDIKIKIKKENLTFGDTDKCCSEIGLNNGVDEFIIYMKKDVVKLYINGKYFSSIRANNNVMYDKLIIKGLRPNDSIYDISGYNIEN